tara:strand:+ start:359 stop:700 length:342 start_codon:yes stop_codon:yes gene_type:complete
MAGRYIDTYEFDNTNQLYRRLRALRGKRVITQYPTQTLNFATIEELQSLKMVSHIWTLGDRYYKLAHKHYGDANLWWIIAQFNKKPTEGHMKLGEVVYIPYPLDRVIEIVRGV